MSTLVNQRSAAAEFGWSAKRYLRFVEKHAIRNARVGRLVVARVDDILAALGLSAEAQQSATSTYRREDTLAAIGIPAVRQ